MWWNYLPIPQLQWLHHWSWEWVSNSSPISYRKYKDYVYRKMLVQEYLKKWRIFKRVKPKNDMMYHDIYNCICQNTKKLRFIIHYVKPTAQLLFRIRVPKGGPTCRRQVVNPRHQTSQGQSVAKPETPLQNIQVDNGYNYLSMLGLKVNLPLLWIKFISNAREHFYEKST